MKKLTNYIKYLPLLLIAGCAGISRDCSGCAASNFGSDWIVLQYAANGEPINCWKLPNTAIDNEEHTDGIFWLDNNTKHLVHISGWYNRVQVSNKDFATAAKSIGIDPDKCLDGKYGK